MHCRFCDLFLLSYFTACSVQPLEDYDTPRAPLIRQVSLDEERLDDCQGHWRGPHLQGEEEERGVRLFRALLLQHLRLEELRPPPCMTAPAKPDQKLVHSSMTCKQHLQLRILKKLPWSNKIFLKNKNPYLKVLGKRLIILMVFEISSGISS